MAYDTVTLSREAYDEMLERIEDLEAALALAEAAPSDDGTRIPLAVVKAELAGTHPVAAWRAYRNLTARALADAAGVNAAYLSEIETGKKPGSLDAYRRLGDALGVPVDILING